MDEKQLQLLWDLHGKSGGFSSFGEFKSLMQNPNSRKVFFDESNKDLGFKDLNEFEETLGVKKKGIGGTSTPSTSNVPSVSQKTGSQTTSIEDFKGNYQKGIVNTSMRKVPDWKHAATPNLQQEPPKVKSTITSPYNLPDKVVYTPDILDEQEKKLYNQINPNPALSNPDAVKQTLELSKDPAIQRKMGVDYITNLAKQDGLQNVPDIAEYYKGKREQMQAEAQDAMKEVNDYLHSLDNRDIELGANLNAAIENRPDLKAKVERVDYLNKKLGELNKYAKYFAAKQYTEKYGDDYKSVGLALRGIDDYKGMVKKKQDIASGRELERSKELRDSEDYNDEQSGIQAVISETLNKVNSKEISEGEARIILDDAKQKNKLLEQKYPEQALDNVRQFLGTYIENERNKKDNGVASTWHHVVYAEPSKDEIKEAIKIAKANDIDITPEQEKAIIDSKGKIPLTSMAGHAYNSSIVSMYKAANNWLRGNESAEKINFERSQEFRDPSQLQQTQAPTIAEPVTIEEGTLTTNPTKVIRQVSNPNAGKQADKLSWATANMIADVGGTIASYMGLNKGFGGIANKALGGLATAQRVNIASNVLSSVYLNYHTALDKAKDLTDNKTAQNAFALSSSVITGLVFAGINPNKIIAGASEATEKNAAEKFLELYKEGKGSLDIPKLKEFLADYATNAAKDLGHNISLIKANQLADVALERITNKDALKGRDVMNEVFGNLPSDIISFLPFSLIAGYKKTKSTYGVENAVRMAIADPVNFERGMQKNVEEGKISQEDATKKVEYINSLIKKSNSNDVNSERISKLPQDQQLEYARKLVTEEHLSNKAKGLTDKVQIEEHNKDIERMQNQRKVMLLKNELGDKDFKDLTDEEKERIEPSKNYYTVKTQPVKDEESDNHVPVLVNSKGEHEIIKKSFKTADEAKVYGEEVVKKRYFNQVIKGESVGEKKFEISDEVQVEAPREIPKNIEIGENAAIEKAKQSGVTVEPPMNIPEPIIPKETINIVVDNADAIKNPIYKELAKDPENADTLLKEISDQWHDERSRPQAEQDFPIEIIEAAKKAYPQAENKGLGEPKLDVNEEQKIEVPLTTTEGGTTNEGVDTNIQEAEGEPSKSGITHEATSETRKQLGLVEYEKPETVENKKLLEDARKTIAENPNAANEVMAKYHEGGKMTREDNAILAEYKAALDYEMEKNPTKETFDRINDLIKVLEPSGSEAGSLLQSRKLIAAQQDNLANFLIDKQTAQGSKLTEKQIKDESAKYVELKKAKEEVDKALAEEREKNAKLIAEVGFNKAKAARKKENKKTDEEHKATRQEILAKAREALKDLRTGKKGTFATVPFVNDLVAIAPHVKDYMKDLIEQGASKLDDVVNAIHAEFKDIVEGIKKSDVIDIIAGAYNEKKEPTKNEKMATLRLLERESRLINEIANERKKVEKEKSEQKVKATNRRIEELEKKLEELKKLNKTEVKKTEGEKEAAYQKRLLDKIAKLQDDLKNKRFSEEKPQEPELPLTPKTRKLLDKYIDLENKVSHERQKDEYEKKPKWVKNYDKIMRVLGIRRIVQSAFDASVAFRQGATLLSSNKYDIWGKSVAKMLKGAFNQSNYDLIMYNIRTSPNYHEMLKDGIVFNDLKAADPTMHNEDFQKSFIYDVPYVGKGLLASNRIADGFLNTARFELYNKFTKNLKEQGITRESDPKEYEDAAKWAMNMTGRGNLLKSLEHSDAQRILGNTFYGARLMASRFNMLNPLTYVKLSPEMRKQALADITSWVGTTIAVGYALSKAGATISLNPDDGDFLQARFGKKVYDISGGMANYVRTYLRVTNAAFDRMTESRYKGVKSAENAGQSVFKFFRNKLSPNTSYAVSAFEGKSGIDKFDPYDFIKIMPMYIPDVYNAWKEDGVTSLATVLLPNMVGIGFNSYAQKGQIDTDLDVLKKRNMTAEDINPETIKNYKEGGRAITNKEADKYAEEWNGKVEKELEKLFNNKSIGVIRDGNLIHVEYKDLTKEELASEIKRIKSEITRETKEALFGVKVKSREEKKAEEQLSRERKK
jgi:hypothetical protein